MRYSTILLLISTVMLTAMQTDSAMACSCAKATAEDILQGASAVFTGTAQQSAPAGPGYSVTTFTVTESFKGAAAGATVRVIHRSDSSAACGVKFSPGQTYTLAAGQIETDPGLATSLCSTWMFAPRVGIGADLIQRMRALRRPQ
jgi:hypothetical protein